MKKLDKKGFTLAELLIVVAIIAILVAIGIPAFSSATERSRESVDLANTRAAYAEFMAGTLSGDANGGLIKITVKQKTAGWTIDTSGVDGLLPSTAPLSGIDYTATTSLNDDNTTYVVFTQDAAASKPTLTLQKTATPPTGYTALTSTGDGTDAMLFFKKTTT